MKLADVQTTTREGAVIAVVLGEVDMSNGAEVGTAVLSATPNEALGVVLDLSRVEYLDSAGIRLLYRLRGSLKVRGQGLKLVIPSGSPVFDALRLAGVADNVDVTPTVDEAVGALPLRVESL